MFFKSLKWRLVSIFFLLVISIMIVVGTYLLYAVEKAYEDEFVNQMSQSKNTFSEKNIEQDISEDSPNYKQELFKTFKNIFAINNVNRKGYMLDSLGGVIYASDPNEEQTGTTLSKTPNILSAMNGEIGDRIPSNDEQLDYAKPILRDGKVWYILYIKYNKQGLQSVLDRLKTVILYSVFSALIISIVLGYLLAQAITGPISKLTDRAKKMASGDFGGMIENQSGDELSKLTDSFNYMSQELKSTLNQISSEKSKLVTLLLHMADGVIAFNKDGEIIHANPASQSILEIDNETKIKFEEVFRHIGLKISKEEILGVDYGGTIQHQIDFKEKYYKIMFASFRDETHEAVGVIAVIQDITEQQKLENMRREFVANVSHELKTPLTSIRTYTETLLDGAVEDKEIAQDFLNVINSEAGRMARIVSDLLQLSRLDYRETRWHKVEFDIGTMAKDVIEKIKIEAKKKRQTLEYINKTNYFHAFADKDGIEQVVVNIVSNSIKYTPEKGRITVEVGNRSDAPYIKVSDNGIGIPEKDLPRIFERFYRVDKARSRDMGGTGLGLSIAKEIVESNGGEILLESKLGRGTSVTIILPVLDKNAMLSAEC